MERVDRPIGERIATYRRRRGISQAVLAGLVGRSESWLSQVERGARSVDRLSVLIDMAKVLKVDVATLTGQPFQLGPNGDIGLDQSGAIRTAVIHSHLVDQEASTDAATVERKVANGQAAYQRAEYRRVAARAPELISQAEATARAAAGAETRRAVAALANAYFLLAALLSRTGETELGWVCADRGIAAAQGIEDRELMTVGLYRLAHVMIRAGRTDEALAIATDAAGVLVRAAQTPSALSIHGSLVLVSVIAASRQDDRRAALAHLREAGEVADRLGGDRNDHWTAFGPTNVQIHALSSAVELGDASGAMIEGEAARTDLLAPGLLGRRSQVHIDLAWAYGQRRNDPATVLSLLEAERIAPEVLRYNVMARELVRECLKRERRSATPGLRALARRVGIDN